MADRDSGAATTALVVATRAAVDRCGPGHVPTPLSPTGTEDGQGRGGGDDPGDPPSTPQTELFDLSDERPGGSRPDRLAGVRPQERVLRHTAEQIVDSAPGLLMLDVPVPQKVEQLLEVLRRLDIEVPAQVIEVPKISQDSISPCVVRGIQHLGQRWKDQGFSVELDSRLDRLQSSRIATRVCQRCVGPRDQRAPDERVRLPADLLWLTSATGSYQECRAEKDTVTLDEESEDAHGGQGSRCRARHRDSLEPTSL